MAQQKSLIYVTCIALMFAWWSPIEAQEDNSVAKEITAQEHRLDFGLMYVNAIFDDNLNGLLSYTHNLSANTNISAEISYLDSRLGEKGGSGFGDSYLTFAWAPRVALSVAPWVPRQVGTGISITLPTGSASDLRSLDATIITPFAGIVVPLKHHFFVYPGLAYTWSTDTLINGQDLSIGAGNIGLGWVSRRGTWVRLDTTWLYDFEASENYKNFQLSAGMSFSPAWGASVSYDDSEYFEPGAAGIIGQRIENAISINLHWNF